MPEHNTDKYKMKAEDTDEELEVLNVRIEKSSKDWLRSLGDMSIHVRKAIREYRERMND